jgi:hypothetical protein
MKKKKKKLGCISKKLVTIILGFILISVEKKKKKCPKKIIFRNHFHRKTRKCYVHIKRPRERKKHFKKVFPKAEMPFIKFDLI